MSTKEMIEVMKAYEQGLKIEYKYKDSNDTWERTIEPAWNWHSFDYRIKPYQRELFVAATNYQPTDIGNGIRALYKRDAFLKGIKLIRFVEAPDEP